MASQRSKDRICLAVAVVLVAASFCYWSAYSINAYYTFHTYGDVGGSAYDMYYHIHYPSVFHGLQYLVFYTHLSPDQLLVLPIFYIYQSPLTLLLVQALVLSLTGLLVFYVAKRLMKDSFFGLLLCFAFLINPGLHGLLVFDYHAEFLIIPFVLLTFYFFMERRRLPFFISLFLLLGTLESAAFVGVALGLGLLSYELIYDSREKEAVRAERMKLSVCIIVFSLLAAAVCACGAGLLSVAYSHGLYPNLSPDLQVINFGGQEVSKLASLGSGFSLNPLVMDDPAYAIYGLAVVFLGFGISALFIPEVTLLFALPWLLEGLILRRGSFLLIGHQYFAYALGGALVAVLLSLMAIRNGSNRFAGLLRAVGGKRPTGRIYKILLVSSLVVFMLSSIFIVSGSIDNLAQDFLFQSTPGQTQQAMQIYSMISLIPPNASVVAPMAVVSHLAERAQLAPLLPWSRPWFTPEYVLVDLNDSLAEPPFYFNYTNFTDNTMSGGGYYLYARNGSVELYRLSVNQT